MSTFTNFTTTVSFADFSAKNQDILVRDSISPKHMSQNKIEIEILQNVYQSTTLTLKNYVDQVLNRAINYYNSILTIAYNKITNLEAEVVYLRRKLVRLPKGNIISKTKVPELPTFACSENKMHLYDWLSQITLYCLASSIILDDQKIICTFIHLHTLASTYMKSYYNKIEAGLSVGS